MRQAGATAAHVGTRARLRGAGFTVGLALLAAVASPTEAPGRTEVSIAGDRFLVNGAPTYEGRTWNGHRVEGLLFNSRMVQGIFDDENPRTRGRFAYPDTGEWDAERNTREFVAAMPSWAEHGMLAFTLNLQGGSPLGYGNQGWRNSAFDPRGALKPEHVARLRRILDRADELGMVAILGYFYFGQDEYFEDEAAIVRATDAATRWILERGYRNVLVELANECDNEKYDQPILRRDRIAELVRRVSSTEHEGRRLLVSVSFNGGSIPTSELVAASDFVLLHGNGVEDPARVGQMVREVRALDGYRPMPVVFNEDDHYDFDRPESNMAAAVAAYASWGYFDFRREGEGFEDGFQSVPVDWRISSERKRAFFGKVREISGLR